MWFTLELRLDNQKLDIVRGPIWGLELPTSQSEVAAGPEPRIPIVAVPVGWRDADRAVLKATPPTGFDVRREFCLEIGVIEDALSEWTKGLEGAELPIPELDHVELPHEWVVGFSKVPQRDSAEAQDYVRRSATAETIYQSLAPATLREIEARFPGRVAVGFDHVAIATRTTKVSFRWALPEARAVSIFLPRFTLHLDVEAISSAR